MTWKTRGQQAADAEMSPKTLNGKSTYRVGHFKDIPHSWNSGRHTKANYRVSEDPKQVHGVKEANGNVKTITTYSDILIFSSSTVDNNDGRVYFKRLAQIWNHWGWFQIEQSLLRFFT